MSVQCKCGHKIEGLESRIAAEVAADRHESSDVRRPYRHETTITQEVK